PVARPGALVDLGAALGERLAHLAGRQGRELLSALPQRCGEPAQPRGPFRGLGPSPRRGRVVRPLQDPVDRVGRGVVVGGARRTGGWVDGGEAQAVTVSKPWRVEPARGMSTRTHRPETAVRPATTAIAPP